MERKHAPFYGIKGKLISAVCMLLVAVIMVVSSTYAWFTLSTAPEVKGISTAIGANGALDIRLNDGQTYNPEAEDKNTTWGNLIDLSTGYGLDKITLLPSKLIISGGQLQRLESPSYTADGRPSFETVHSSTFGKFSEGEFIDSSELGVRAVGYASGLTAQQIAYRDALSAASIASGQAQDAAVNSLNKDGALLANAIIRKATETTEKPAKFTAAEVEALGDILKAFGYDYTVPGDNPATTETVETDYPVPTTQAGLLDFIDKAYVQLVIGYAASYSEEAFAAVKNFEKLSDIVKSATVTGNATDGYTVTLTLADVFTNVNITALPDGIANGIKAYYLTRKNVSDAYAAKAALPTAQEYLWDDFYGILKYLVDKDKMTVNGYTAEELVADNDAINDLANSAMKDGIKVEMTSGAGVYADVSDQCGNYDAGIKIDIVYGSLALDDVEAKMLAKTDVTPTYLTVATEAVKAKKPPAADTGDLPLSDFYGYVIDLAFMTNAASSELLLQVDAKDRIYSDNAESSETYGGGSYMTFTSTSNSFGPEKVKALMGFIRIVFFDTDNSTILGYAKLDTDTATTGADGVTAKMYMYKTVYKYTYTPEGGEAQTCYALTKDATAFYSDNLCKTSVALDEGVVPSYVGEEEAKLTGANAVITSLTQNVEVKVSTLVYLDGENIQNKDVASMGSVTGKMNIQFSSSAELTPMEYGALHTPNSSETATDSAATGDSTEAPTPGN